MDGVITSGLGSIINGTDFGSSFSASMINTLVSLALADIQGGIGDLKLEKTKDVTAAPSASANAAISDQFTMVPRLDVQASAGNGSLAQSEEPIDFLAFQDS